MGGGNGMGERRLNLGFLGLGVGGLEIMRTAHETPQINLVAAADIVSTTRERFHERYPDAAVYDTAEALCADPKVEAIWVATPNRFHAQHAILQIASELVEIRALGQRERA